MPKPRIELHRWEDDGGSSKPNHMEFKAIERICKGCQQIFPNARDYNEHYKICPLRTTRRHGSSPIKFGTPEYGPYMARASYAKLTKEIKAARRKSKSFAVNPVLAQKVKYDFEFNRELHREAGVCITCRKKPIDDTRSINMCTDCLNKACERASKRTKRSSGKSQWARLSREAKARAIETQRNRRRKLRGT